jgi:hypothetical protein
MVQSGRPLLMRVATRLYQHTEHTERPDCRAAGETLSIFLLGSRVARAVLEGVNVRTVSWAALQRIRDRIAFGRVLLPLGIPAQRSQDRYAPFFIVGSGRSGMTLLRRFLIAIDGVHIPPETYVLGPVIGQFWQLRSLRWQELVPILLSRFQFHPEFRAFGLESLLPLVEQLKNTPRSQLLSSASNSHHFPGCSFCPYGAGWVRRRGLICSGRLLR